MKVLHLTNIGMEALLQDKAVPGDFGGGVAASVRDISLATQKSYGYESIITSCYETDFIDWANEFGLKTHVIPGRWVSFMGRPMLFWLSVRDIVSLVKKENITIIHAHHYNAALWAGIAAKKCGIPMVFTLHQDVTDYLSYSKNVIILFLSFLRRKVKHFLWSIPYRTAQRVIPVSEYVAKSAEKSGFTGGNVTVIYNGIDTEKFKPGQPERSIRKELGLTKDHILIGTSSRLDVPKGYIEAIKAAVEVKKNAPMARFVFVGEGPEKEKYLKLANELSVDDIVFFPGFRSNIAEVLQDLDIWIFPTYHVEGFSISLLEAQAVGLPCIVSDMGGNAECVINRETGLLIPVRCVDELAAAIMELYENPDFAKKLGDAARTRVKAGFSIQKQVEDLVKIYKDVCLNKE